MEEGTGVGPQCLDFTSKDPFNWIPLTDPFQRFFLKNIKF